MVLACRALEDPPPPTLARRMLPLRISLPLLSSIFLVMVILLSLFSFSHYYDAITIIIIIITFPFLHLFSYIRFSSSVLYPLRFPFPFPSSLLISCFLCVSLTSYFSFYGRRLYHFLQLLFNVKLQGLILARLNGFVCFSVLL